MKREDTVAFSGSALRPLDRKSLHHIVDKAPAALEKSETQTIPAIPPVARSIKERATCSAGHRSIGSNLRSGANNGVGQSFQ